MKRLNKKGFTLIELLAVIIILGILMIIAIPSVTSYIQNSRKSAYVDTAVAYTDAVMKEVNAGKNLRLYSTNTLYMIPVGHDGTQSCVTLESGGQSPFDDKWRYAYVGVTYDGKGYNYYFMGEDNAGQGISFIDKKTLTDDGTDYLYSSHGTLATLDNNNASAEVMSDAFATILAGYYNSTTQTPGASTEHKEDPTIPQGQTTAQWDENYKTVFVDYLTAVESKTIQRVVFVGQDKNCTYQEQIVANNP